MQEVSTALATRLASRQRRPGILLEIYAASYVPAVGAEFAPSAAVERFSIKTINWLGQDYRREMRAIPTVKRNKGKEFSTMSLSFSNMDRYMASFFLNNTVAGMWAVLRYVERDIQSTIADSLVLFVGRCEQPGDATQQTAALTVKQALGSVTQQVPWRTFDAVCPLVPVYHQEGEDCVGFNPDGTPILLTEKPAAYQSHLTCGGSHSDCAERENLRFYQAFYFQPIGGSFQYTVREQRQFLFFFHRTRNRTATGQYSNADGTPYGTAVRTVIGRAQLEAVPIKFIDEGNELVTWAAWCEGLLAALQNVRNNTAGFTQPRFQADFLGDYGGNNGQDPVVHNGVTGEYYSRLAYSALVVSGSTPDVVDSPVTFSAVAVGAYPLPDDDGNFTAAGATSNPAYLTRFFLTDHHVMRHPTALVDDDETVATAAWCDRPLIDNTTGEAAPIPSSIVADGGVRFRRYLSTGVLDPDFYRYRLGEVVPAPYEREIDYAQFEFPDDAPPDQIAPYVVLRRRYTANGVISESVAAIDYLYDTLLTAFRGYLVTKRDGRIAIRSERPADVVYLQDEYDVDATALEVDDVEQWFNNLDGYLLLNPGDVASEYHEVILAEYTGNGTSFNATSSGTLVATPSSSKFLGGGPAVPESAQVTLSGTAEAGAQVYITAAGTDSAAYTLADGDTLETAAALLADTVNADPTVGRYVRAVWTVDTPTVVTFHLKWGLLTLAEGLTNLQAAATEGIRIQYAFDASSIVKDSFKWPGDQRQQYNQIKLKYREAKDDFAVTTLVYNDKANQIATGKTSTLNIDGGCIDNYHQAYRILLAARARYIDGNKVASWTTTRGTALLLEEGDVVAVTDDSNGLINYPVTVETASLAAKLQLSFTARHYATVLFVDEPPRAPVKIPSTLLGLPPTATDLLLLNFPQLRTSDPALGTLNTVGVTVAASLPSGTTVWPTAELWIDRGNGYAKLSDLPLEATVGRGVFVLATATPQAWDNTHTITIDLDRPLATLPSGTMGNPVRILYGKEVIDYVTATQLSTAPNRWQLSGGLYRGAAGTDAHVGDHLAGDIFALVNEAVQYIPLETSDIATARDFKVIQKGVHPQTLDGVSAHGFTLSTEYIVPPDRAGVPSRSLTLTGLITTIKTTISEHNFTGFAGYVLYNSAGAEIERRIAVGGGARFTEDLATINSGGTPASSYTLTRKVKLYTTAGQVSANFLTQSFTYLPFLAPANSSKFGVGKSGTVNKLAINLNSAETSTTGNTVEQIYQTVFEVRDAADNLLYTDTVDGYVRDFNVSANYADYPVLKVRARFRHVLYNLVDDGAWSGYFTITMAQVAALNVAAGTHTAGYVAISQGDPTLPLLLVAPATGGLLTGGGAAGASARWSGTTVLATGSIADTGSGHIAVGAGATVDQTYSGHITSMVVNVQETLTDPAIQKGAGLWSYLKIALSGDHTGTNDLYGTFTYAETQIGNSAHVNDFMGLSAAAWHLGTGTVGAMHAATFDTANRSGGHVTSRRGITIITGSGTLLDSGLTDQYIGVALLPNVGTTETVTSMRGLHVQINNAGAVGQQILAYLVASNGTFTGSNYGLFIGDQSAGVTSPLSYNLWSDGATTRNYFGGQVSVGLTPYTYANQARGRVALSGTNSELTLLDRAVSVWADADRFAIYNNTSVLRFWSAGAERATLSATGTLTVTGQYSTTVTTGTAPLIIASTTKVTNLNADLLDGLDSTAFQPIDATLTALAAFNSNGLLTQTAADTFVARALTQPAAGLTITNADGVAGNPIFALANDLAAVEGLATAGVAVRTATDAWAVRTLTQTANQVLISNADGVAGNPTFSLPQDIHTAAIPTFAGLTATGNIFINSSTANLYMKDTVTGWQVAATSVITPQANNFLRSTTFTSGLVGWNISAAGSAEFDNVDIRGAIHASIFTFNAIAATAGTLGVFKSAAKLKADVTVPASPTYGTTTVTVDAVDSEGITHAASQLFAVNDILRLKDGLVGDTWLKVSAASDQTTFWRYTCIIMAGTANVTYRTGMGVPDYGSSGAGFIIGTADQTNSPYIQMATHAAGFSSTDAAGSLTVTPRLRMGNLNGSYGYASDVYGFGTGKYGAASESWVTVDSTNGVRLGNNTTVLTQIAADGSAFFGNGNLTISSGGVLTIGSWTVNSSTLTGTSTTLDSAGKLTLGTGNNVVILDAVDATYRLAIGNATYASAPFRVDKTGALTATGVNVTGAITATSGAINGPLTMSGATSSIAIGSTPPTSATAGTGIWLDRTVLAGLQANKQTFALSAADGTLKLGSDLSAAATTGVVVAGTAITYNSESLAAGAILIGDNSSGQANLLMTGGAVKLRRGTTNYITLDATDTQFTNLIKMSGSSAAISIGATPPTSATAGTGVWLDNTGLHGLVSNAVKFFLDATTGALALPAANPSGAAGNAGRIVWNLLSGGKPTSTTKFSIGTASTNDIPPAFNYAFINSVGDLQIIAGSATNTFTSGGGLSVVGTVSATTFSGSGASLTSIPNAALTNSSITIQGSAVSLGGSTLATTSTPQFARLGLGTAADATHPLKIGSVALISSVGSMGVNTTDADNQDGTGVGSNGGQFRLVGGNDGGTGHLSMFKLLPQTTGVGRFAFLTIGADWDSSQINRRGNFEFYDVNALKTRFAINSNGSIVIGNGGQSVSGATSALATSATDGFFYIPTCAGTPTGTPTAYTGAVPLVFDSTNNKLYAYNGAWKQVTLT